MSKTRDRVIQIFIEESTEVIELLETELITLEESPWDKSIINEIFRGVHTLKGNANSFGFTKLGGFVHYFEDLLDYYREPNNQITNEIMQLIFDAYDIIKEVFTYEKDGIDKYPDNYNVVLDEIKKFLDVDLQSTSNSLTLNNEQVVSKNHYHHDKFDTSEAMNMAGEFKELILEKCNNGKKVYNVIMEFDDDIYIRGYNHTLFYKLFESVGEVVKSYWYMDKSTPVIEDFDINISYIKKISLYLVGDASMEDVEDVFEFIAEDNEVGISIVDCTLFSQNVISSNDNDAVETEEIVEQSGVESSDETPKSNDEKSQANVTKTVSQAKSIRIESTKLDELFDSIGELVIAQSFIDQNEQIRALNNIEINQYLSMLNKTTRLIQNKVMNLRMVPIRDTFFKMKRVARDVSKKTGKDVDLVIAGEETEIDKTMVDSLSEPLIHIIRNSIDHGIEANEADRIASGKDTKGVVNLTAMHKGSNFIIEIKDDGRGIDTDAILKKALEKGIASSEEEYTKDEILNFLFAPGFSTAAEITDVSGRGVGLDVVRQSIEGIKGKIQIDSVVGEGSTFKIILPLTLAIIDGLSVLVKDEIFIVPTLTVVESFRAKRGEIQTAKNKGEFINFRGDILPVLKLGKLLGIDDGDMNVEETTLICIEHERGRYVIQVNELLGRQQVVIKSLSKRLAQVKEISGAAIMGSGDIALILNTEGIRDWLDNDTSVAAMIG